MNRRIYGRIPYPCCRPTTFPFLLNEEFNPAMREQDLVKECLIEFPERMYGPLSEKGTATIGYDRK